jgi:hypothetical protein
MEKTFIQHKAKEINPEVAGWYNTDKGNLFWFKSETVWSCRDDRVSEEYPSFWYQSSLPSEIEAELRKEIDDLKSELTIQKQKVKLNYNSAVDYEKQVTSLKQQIEELTSKKEYPELKARVNENEAEYMLRCVIADKRVYAMARDFILKNDKGWNFKEQLDKFIESLSTPVSEVPTDKINSAIDFGFEMCKKYGDITKPERENFMKNLSSKLSDESKPKVDLEEVMEKFKGKELFTDSIARAKKFIEGLDKKVIDEGEIERMADLEFPNDITDFHGHQSSRAEGFITGFKKALSLPIKKEGEWISVEERLPENADKVLVFINTSGKHLVCFFIDGKFEEVWDRSRISPSHWMPLPKAPGNERGT